MTTRFSRCTLVLLVCSSVTLSGCAVNRMTLDDLMQSVNTDNPPTTVAETGLTPIYAPIDANALRIVQQSEQILSPNESDSGTSEPLNTVPTLPLSNNGLSLATTLSQRQDYSAEQPNYYNSLTHKQLRDYASQLMMTMAKNTRGLPIDANINVGHFVEHHGALESVGNVGYYIIENLVTEGQRLGLNFAYPTLSTHNQNNSRGTVFFDTNKANDFDAFTHVMTGTLTPHPQGLIVNARIIDRSSKRIVSAADIVLPEFIIDQVAHLPPDNTAIEDTAARDVMPESSNDWD